MKERKKEGRSLLLGFLLLSSAAFYSQRGVLVPPQEGQGFIVFDNSQFDYNVTAWNISIFRRIYSDSDTNFVDRTVFRSEINGQDYFKIPEEYKTEGANFDYFYSFQGLNSSSDIIVSEGPHPIGNGTQYVNQCYWDCDGFDYAHRVQLLVHPNGGAGQLATQTAYQHYDPSISLAVPYYQYISSSDYNQLISSSNTTLGNYYNYHQITSLVPSDHPVNVVKHENVTTSDNYYDINGTILTGTVYAIKKGRGLWAGANVQTSNTTYTASDCIHDLQWAENQLNTVNGGTLFSDQGYPNLDCIPGASPFSGSQFDTDCLLGIQNYTLGTDGDIFNMLNVLESCLTGTSPYIANLWISKFPKDEGTQGGDDDGKNVFFEDLYSANGEFTSPNITLEPGLYTFGVRFSDGTYLPVIKEVEKTLVSVIELSDFLDVTVFPVPIIDDEFTLQMAAEAKLKFDFILTDFNGEEKFRKNFVLQKGHSRNHKIKVNKGLSEGFYFCTFHFEDGSMKTIQILK
jgi:hypothetical protein